MDIGQRLRHLRCKLGLTQTEFADKLCIRQTHISAMEKGVRNITDRTISDICRETGVNEEWLKNGIGEMFTSNSSNYIEELVKEYHLDSTDITIITEYLKLDKTSRTVLKNYIKNVFLATENSTNCYIPDTPEELEKLYPPVDIDEIIRKK